MRKYQSKILLSATAIGLMTLSACEQANIDSPRQDTPPKVAADLYEDICLEGEAPGEEGMYVYGGDKWQHDVYDIVVDTNGGCRLQLGSSTPYDQIYQAFQAEIPQGGYKIQPIGQGQAGQIDGRNYFIVSKP